MLNQSETVNNSKVEFSSGDTFSLPWHEMGSSSLQPISSPSVIETSRWTKLVMLKACKVFGINVAGFEHEILGTVLCMEQRRQDQKQHQSSSIKNNAKGKKKQSLELERLKWGMNSDDKKEETGGKYYKAFSG